MQEPAAIQPHSVPSSDVEPERLLYSINDGRRALGGIGRTTIWRMVNAGQLEAVKIGGRTFLKADSVRRAARDGAATAAE